MEAAKGWQGMNPQRAKKRKMQGRDWHAWANEFPVDPDDAKSERVFVQAAEPKRPPGRAPNQGRWVRVKFVKVD